MQVNRSFTPACLPDQGQDEASVRSSVAGGDWRERAVCASTDPELFFPLKGGGKLGPALAVCAGCPVREQCLAFALDNRIMHGIWGGLSERRRRRLLAGVRTKAAR